MKTSFLISSLMFLISVTAIQAQTIPARPNEGVRKEGRMSERKDLMAGLNLSTEQKANLKALKEENRSLVAAIRNDNNLTPDQKKAKIETLRDGQKAKMNALLTADQKARLEKNMADRKLVREKGMDKGSGDFANENNRNRFKKERENGKWMDELNLTEDQKLKMKAVDEEGRNKMEALHKAQQSKREAILTPAQKNKWEKMKADRQQRMSQRRMHNPGGFAQANHRKGFHKDKAKLMKELKLSDQQQTKLKALKDERQAKVRSIRDDINLTPEQKKAQLQALHKDQKARREAVLTTEQRAKWEAARKSSRNRQKYGA